MFHRKYNLIFILCTIGGIEMVAVLSKNKYIFTFLRAATKKPWITCHTQLLRVVENNVIGIVL